MSQILAFLMSILELLTKIVIRTVWTIAAMILVSIALIVGLVALLLQIVT